jgi:mRNA interferase RelE/StbE
MAMYKISFTKQANKSLGKMPLDVAMSIRDKLKQIATDPYAPHANVTKLQNRPGYRLRVGDWRVIYEVQKTELVVLVLKIGPRGGIYR